jgi:uncharacterized protein YxeA
MKKTLLIVLFIVLIVVLAGILYLYWPQITGNTNKAVNKNVNKNENVNATTNVNKGVNLNLSKETGDIKLEKAVTYKEVVFNLTTASEKEEFHSTKAESGKKLVILYLDKITQSTPAEIFTWIKQDVILTSSQNKDYTIKEIKIIGKSAADYDTGYLVFEVPTGDNGFKLRFGQGDKQQIAELGF